MRGGGRGGRSRTTLAFASPGAPITPLILTPPAPARPAVRRTPLSPRAATAVVIGVALALRLAWAAVMPVNKDEGYHYLYTVHPSLSYFDHPPMLAAVTAGGLLACGGQVSPFSIRVGFVLISAATAWVLARWTAGRYGERAGLWAAVLWNLAPFFSLGAGGQVMPDGPFLFFALLTLIALGRAVVDEKVAGTLRVPSAAVGTRSVPATLPWVWVGLAWAGALLSKYHAVFLPAGAVLYILLTPAARRVLLTPGPYLAVLIGVAGFAPVLYWNATHEWASFAYQGGRAVGTEFRPEFIARMLVGQLGYLGPFLWAAVLVVLVNGLRRWRANTNHERLLLCLAVVPLSFFLAVSFVRITSGYWTLVGVLPLLPLAARQFVEWADRRPRAVRLIVAGWAFWFVTLTFLFAVHARTGLFAAAVPIADDPLNEQCGWESLADRLDAHGLVGRPNTFVFCGGVFHEGGQIGFATAGRAPVLSYSRYDTRGFAYWSRPDDWLGWDGVMVALDDRPWEPKDYAPYFSRVELIDDFWMTRNGQPVRHVRLYLCTNQVRPFPFTCPTLPAKK